MSSRTNIPVRTVAERLEGVLAQSAHRPDIFIRQATAIHDHLEDQGLPGPFTPSQPIRPAKSKRPSRTDYLGHSLRVDPSTGKPVPVFLGHPEVGTGIRQWVRDDAGAEGFPTAKLAWAVLSQERKLEDSDKKVPADLAEVYTRFMYADGTMAIVRSNDRISQQRREQRDGNLFAEGVRLTDSATHGWELGL
jgi:hypothetical protein